jgi:hypothetical protein
VEGEYREEHEEKGGEGINKMQLQVGMGRGARLK